MLCDYGIWALFGVVVLGSLTSYAIIYAIVETMNNDDDLR